MFQSEKKTKEGGDVFYETRSVKLWTRVGLYATIRPYTMPDLVLRYA